MTHLPAGEVRFTTRTTHHTNELGPNSPYQLVGFTTPTGGARFTTPTGGAISSLDQSQRQGRQTGNLWTDRVHRWKHFFALPSISFGLNSMESRSSAVEGNHTKSPGVHTPRLSVPFPLPRVVPRKVNPLPDSSGELTSRRS